MARTLCLLLLGLVSLGATPHDLVLVGSGGEREYEQRFADWQRRLETVLVERVGRERERVHAVAGPDSLRAIERVFARLQNEVGADDALFVWLIGHGSYRNGTAKLNIPGPDLSADRLGVLLRGLATERIVLVNAASASSAFIPVLSAEGRVLCTSTRSTEERNAPVFMEYLLTALEGESADQDRDGRISVLEVCAQADILTQASYEDKGLLATEHALLDGDGDGLGTRLSVRRDERLVSVAAAPGESGDDAAQAAAVFLRDMQYPSGASAELVRQYERALAAVEALVDRRQSLGEDAYYRRLEALFLDVARISVQIWPVEYGANIYD